MSYRDVFTFPLQVKHKAKFWSKAYLINFLLNVVLLVAPFLVSYRTQGFWLNKDTYNEQPDVHFKYEYFLLLETESLETTVVCTTFPLRSSTGVNACPFTRVREQDTNRDGRNEFLEFDIEARIDGPETVHESHSWLHMESLGHLKASSSLGGSRLSVHTELHLHQKEPLKSSVSTRLNEIHSLWTRGRAMGEPFRLSLRVNYIEDVITYTPGFWHVMKYSWVQYVALLIPTFIVIRNLKYFIFTNFLVHTVKQSPIKTD